MSNLVSVIVPIYNVEKYLPRCIESIIGQTYHNLEIFLVDDGSTDGCGKICDYHAAQDKRVKVIHKQNGGLSDARNCALDLATGDYVLFIDSDDWLDSRAIELLMSIAITRHADIVECNIREVHSDFITINNACTGSVESLTRKNAIEECIRYGKIKPVACNKLYRRSAIGEIRYPVGKLHEDEFTTHKIFFNAKKIYFFDLALYNYTCSREDSITAKFTAKNLDGSEAMRQKIHFVLERPELEGLADLVCNTYCYVLFDQLSKCVQNKIQETPEAQLTINAAITEKRELFKHHIEPLYRKCLIELEKNGVEACVAKWNARKAAS